MKKGSKSDEDYRSKGLPRRFSQRATIHTAPDQRGRDRSAACDPQRTPLLRRRRSEKTVQVPALGALKVSCSSARERKAFHLRPYPRANSAEQDAVAMMQIRGSLTVTYRPWAVLTRSVFAMRAKVFGRTVGWYIGRWLVMAARAALRAWQSGGR